jgi:hypothetical protein
MRVGPLSPWLNSACSFFKLNFNFFLAGVGGGGVSKVGEMGRAGFFSPQKVWEDFVFLV